jgi:serine/threonine-protein kinase
MPTLAAGEKLGPYEILAPIGAGGMGEVYRARDTKLKRDVALKVLPEAFARDPGRMARFQREAEVLASLNHPNIAHIYGVEERALVMELVEGESPKGPLPFEDAWKIALQIADALEYAHERGVIHRDLKPANVKVTPDGLVKLLDFGLAKAFTQTPDSAAADPENSPTVTLGATVAGTIMGTAAYMSPEQAKGKRVDKRADIWSWGVVLYELLTGERLFQGEDAADTLAAVIHKQPDLEKAPPQVRLLLGRCLEKDPKKRLRDISVAKELLEEKPQATAASQPRLSSVGWIAAAVLALIAAVASLNWWRATRPVEHSLVRLDVDLGSDISLSPPTQRGSTVSLSPDGARLVYSARVGGGQSRLFTKRLDRLDQPKAVELPGTEGAQDAFFSPDGQWIGFVTATNLSKISVQGGAAVPLADAGGFAGATWGEDDNIILSEPFGRGLRRIPAAGGSESVLAALGNGDPVFALPQILPRGNGVLFTGVGANQNLVEILTLPDHRRKTLAKGQSPHYLAVSAHDGYLLYTDKATMFAVPFDLDKLQTRGTAVPILDDIAYNEFSGAGQFSLSANGTLVYRRGGASAGPPISTIEWLDTAGKRQPLLTKPRAYGFLRFSPHGKRLATQVTDPSDQDLWIYDPERDLSTNLTATQGFGAVPVWTPDGRYIVFASTRSGLWWTRSDGAGQPQQLFESHTAQVPFSFATTPDGKLRLAYYQLNPRPQIWTVPVKEGPTGLKGETPVQFFQDQSTDLAPAFSPDGRWLAYSSSASGNFEFYVRPFPPESGEGGRAQISNGGAGTNVFGIAWSRTGHELYYQSGDQIMAVSYSIKGDTFMPDKPRVWISKLGGTQWDLVPNGNRVAVITPVTSSQTPQQDHTVVFLLNFLDYLKQQVPLNK